MTQQSSGPGRPSPELIGDFQRWLFRSGAREMSRELGGQIAATLGLGGKSGDVWQDATAPPRHEAPECAWCPLCRAARTLRESGPGLASHAASAGEALAGLVQDAAATVEAVLGSPGRRSGTGQDRPDSAAGQAAAGPADGGGTGDPAAASPAGEDTAGIWDAVTGEEPGPPGRRPG